MKRVKAHIVTRMKKQGQTIQQQALGSLYPRENGWYLIYSEEANNQDEEEPVSTTIKAYPDKVVIIRTGAVRMRQEYIPGRWTEGKYQGPFGYMRMETKTRRVRSGDHQLQLDYVLKLNGQDMGPYELSIIMEEL